MSPLAGGPPPIRVESLQVYKSIRGPDAEKRVSNGVAFWKVVLLLVALVVMGFLIVLGLAHG